MNRITKAVVPAAGIGSRLLPLTKSIPKELLPVDGKPVIQWTVEELVASGIHDITIVVSPGKEAIQNHFRADDKLVAKLRAAGKNILADAVDQVANLADITFVRQNGPYGNATPVLNADPGEPFVVLWPDDVFVTSPGGATRTSQLMDVYDRTGHAVMAVERFSGSFAAHVTHGPLRPDGLVQVEYVGLLEGGEDPSIIFPSIGGYVVTPGVVKEIIQMTAEYEGLADREIALSEAFSRYAQHEMVVGTFLDGTWLDTGTLDAYAAALTYFLMRGK